MVETHIIEKSSHRCLENQSQYNMPENIIRTYKSWPEQILLQAGEQAVSHQIP